MSLLAADLVPWIVGLGALSVVLLALIVVAPFRRVRNEPKLDEEIETRLLLGEDPEELDRELSARADEAASIADLRPDEGGTRS
jgi:hypothetical protein